MCVTEQRFRVITINIFLRRSKSLFFLTSEPFALGEDSEGKDYETRGAHVNRLPPNKSQSSEISLLTHGELFESTNLS